MYRDSTNIEALYQLLQYLIAAAIMNHSSESKSKVT